MVRAKPSKGRRITRVGANSRQSERVRIGLARRIFTKTSLVVAVIVVGVLLLGTGALAIYHKIYAEPQTVFWQMIDNNLATAGVTETTDQVTGRINKHQTSQLSFNPSPAVLQTTSQIDTASQPMSRLDTIVIGTRTADYRRITLASNLQKGDSASKYKSLYSLWVKNPVSSPFPQSVNSVLLSSPVIFGNLPAATRANLVKELRSSYVIKEVKQSGSGKRTYIYNVNIKLRKYTQVVKDYAKEAGLASASVITPEVYKAQDAVGFSFKVDVLSRQLQKITRKDKSSQVTYSSYGQKSEITAPVKTIDAVQFSQRVNSLQR